MNPSYHSFFRTSFGIWLLAMFVLTATTSCSQDQQDRVKEGMQAALPDALTRAAGPQPTLDSVYIVRYMNTEPRFKTQIDWAKKFYKAREFKLGWFRDHELVPQAETMLGVIGKAADEGLNPKDYQVVNFEPLLKELKAARNDTTRRSELEKKIDVALSATYFNYASDFYRGTVDPRAVKSIDWDVKRNKVKLHKALMTILQERESTYGYYDFEPLHSEYDRLKKVLADYREMERKGGWPAIPAGTSLKPGATSPAVAALRGRLLGPDATAPTSAEASAVAVANKPGQPAAPVAQKYDAELFAAVKEFQRLNGLKPDGVVGGETLRELNVPLGQRIQQIMMNMERWRWIPKKFEPDYLLVNIPEYKLHVVEDGKEAFTMPVIVGKRLNATPIFSDKVEFVVMAPYWNVPWSIIDKELRPKLAANPQGTLDRLDMEVVKGWGAKATPVDARSIDWANLQQKDWKYTLRRRPGPKNDLGNVKFIFPNSNDIYLHDTPNDELFSQTKRGFSHGCVRVAEPIRLAEYLLRNKAGWDEQAINDAIASRQEKYVTLPEKLPVYLVYFTTWVDDDGKVHFRDDIYGHDKALAKQYFN